MKPEKLLPMAGILAALLVVGYVVKRKPARQDITQQFQLVRLVPADLRVADIERAEFYRGADPKAGVVLLRRRDDKGEPAGWTVESRFGAPGDATKIEEFLAKIRDREGEFRSGKAEVLGDFQLLDDQALHIALYRKDRAEAESHLLVGKGENFRGCFVRRKGQNEVYSVDADLRTDLGFWGGEEKQQPESAEWISKVVIDLDREKIARIELDYPDKKLALEKKKAETPAPVEEGKDAPPTPAAAATWTLAAGGPRTGAEGALAPLTEHGYNTILNALDNLRASDIVDPSKKAEYGLDSPAYRCAAVMEDGKRHVLLAGRPLPGGEAYLLVEGTEKPVFKMERYYFDNLFKQGGELFQLPGLTLKEEEVSRVAIRLPAGSLAFERSVGEMPKGWTLVDPAGVPPLRVQADKVDALLQRFARSAPADYADDAAVAGFEAPAATVELTNREGKSWLIRLGKESTTVAGRYAEIVESANPAAGKAASPGVVGASDVAIALAPLGNYLDLKAMALEAGQVSRIAIVRAEKPFTLHRKVTDGQAGGPWMLQTPEGDKEADATRVNALVSNLVALTGSDVRFGNDAASPPALAQPAFTLRVETAAGASSELAFGPAEEGRILALPAGHSYGLLFPAGVAADLAPDPATLLPAAASPEKKPEEAPAPGPGGDGESTSGKK